MQLHLYGLAADVNVYVSASMQGKTSSPEVSSAAVRAWVRLNRSQQAIQSSVERALKAAGLPPLGWYDVLLELSRPADGRLRPFEIEERTLLAQYNLSRLLDRLEREGLVRREALDGDGRGRWVVITAKGRQVQTLMWQVYSQALHESVAARLDDSEADRLSDLLEKLVGRRPTSL